MSPVRAERRRPSWLRKAEPFAFKGPRVSNAKGMTVCVWASDLYLSAFRSAAPSAAAPAVDDVAWMYDSSKVSVSVTSQVIHFPACHGICVSSWDERSRPIGSLTAGTLARPTARQTRSFRVWWRDVLPALRLQARPWVPSGHSNWLNLQQWKACPIHVVWKITSRLEEEHRTGQERSSTEPICCRRCVYWSITPEQNRVLKVTCARSWGQEGWRRKWRHTPDAQATISDRQTGLLPLDIGEVGVGDGADAISEQVVEFL